MEQLRCRRESGRSGIELITAHESMPELELCRVSDKRFGESDGGSCWKRGTTTGERRLDRRGENCAGKGALMGQRP